MRVAFGQHQLDTEARTLERDGQRVSVEPKVFDLIAYLIRHREHVASSEELLDALWPGVSVGPAALSGALHKARQAVGDDGEHQSVLHTEHGRGFRFVADVFDVPATQAAHRRSRARRIAAAGGAALLLAAASFWLLNRSPPEAFSGHSLAVLPFVNMSTDPDQAYFADGIAEELLSTLARFEGLRVVGRTSSFSFRNSDADLKEIGEALGVDVILEGSVRMEGDRVRITAQLVDAHDGYHRWAETYDRDLGDILAIQTEIATNIATALRVSLSAKERDRLVTLPTKNLAAYQAYLLGKQRMDRFTNEALAASVDYFQRAIELDPNFAVAHVGLAESLLLQDMFLFGAQREETLANVRSATERALDLDDQLGEAYTTLAWIEMIAERFEPAEATFRRALELNPNHPRTYHLYGALLRDDLGRPEEALALHRRGLELDPLSSILNQNAGEDLGFLGRFDEALTHYERTIEADPGYAMGYYYIGDHHWRVSARLDEATLWLGKSISFDPDQAWFHADLGLLLLDLGDVGRAEHAITRSVELSTDDRFANIAMGLLHVYRGEGSPASNYGRKALELSGQYDLVVGWLVSALLRDQELRAGRYAEALALYEGHESELLGVHAPELDDLNYRTAIDLALVLFEVGEQQRAELLLDRSLQHVKTAPRLGWHGHGIADVKIHALRGEKDQALSALRQAIDEGWRFLWWYFLEHDPNLQSLHDEPEFQAMLEEIRAEMALQLERVREMERRGELVFPAALPTPRGRA
jgi:TolB-like protein/Tfp pilus assembly protein PilF